jgi:hypothetical protein
MIVCTGGVFPKDLWFWSIEGSSSGPEEPFRLSDIRDPKTERSAGPIEVGVCTTCLGLCHWLYHKFIYAHEMCQYLPLMSIQIEHTSTHTHSDNCHVHKEKSHQSSNNISQVMGKLYALISLN